MSDYERRLSKTARRSFLMSRSHAWRRFVVGSGLYGTSSERTAFYAGFEIAWMSRQTRIDSCLGHMREMSTRIHELERERPTG